MNGDELKRLRESKGISQPELAKELGVSVRQIVNLENGKTPIRDIYIEKISSFFGVTGNQSGHLNKNSVINIPMIEAYAGCGSAVGFSEMLVSGGDNLTIDPRIFPSDFLRPHLAAIRIAGDSMEPTLRGGDIAFVQTKNGSDIVEVGDVYLIAYDGGVYIKRLHFQGRKVKIISDNPMYDPFWYEHGDSQIEFDIIGKVVAVLRFGTPLLFK